MKNKLSIITFFNLIILFFILPLLFKQIVDDNLGIVKEINPKNTFLPYIFYTVYTAVSTEMASFISPLCRNSVVHKIAPPQKLREPRNDGSLLSCIVTQCKHWCSYQHVIWGDCKQGFLLKLN